MGYKPVNLVTNEDAEAVATTQRQADQPKQEMTMSQMNALALGDVANAMASEKRRELNDWVLQDRRAAVARAHAGRGPRAAAGAALIRVGGWVGGANVAPAPRRQLAH